MSAVDGKPAPGGPGLEPRWTSSAKSGVGTAFDQRKFHDAILALGSVPLPVLEQRMAQFIADGGNNPAIAPRAERAPPPDEGTPP